MAVSLVLLAVLLAVANMQPELADGAGNEERVLEIFRTKTHCNLNLEVVYPLIEGQPPYPLCSSECLLGEELWIDGVVVKRLSELKAFGLMVELTYKNGGLQGCKMVPYDSAENSSARQGAQKRCAESFCSSGKESPDKALVPSVAGRMPDALTSIPLHQRLEGFTRVGNSYYWISPEDMSWYDAVDYCNRLGAPLALIESSSEQDKLQEVLSAEVWIGLNDIVAEGIFVNAGYTPITYSSWHPGEPNNRGYSAVEEDCGMLKGLDKFLWNDINCNHTNIHALCEHPPVNINRAQYLCAPGYWKSRTSCYILSDAAGTYSRGEEFCSSKGAYPVFINSQEEQDYVTGKLKETTYIGYKEDGGGRFISSQFGVPLFNRWDGGNQPNATGDNDCVAMGSKSQPLWHDYSCNSEFRMLCEKAADIRP